MRGRFFVCFASLLIRYRIALADMDIEELREQCLSLPGATENIQWGNNRVFKIAGKMFACSGVEPDSRYSFKCDQERFLELTDQPGIVPAPYLARASWVQIDDAGNSRGLFSEYASHTAR